VKINIYYQKVNLKINIFKKGESTN